MGLLKNCIESEQELKEIKKEMKMEKELETQKLFQETFHVSDAGFIR